MSKKIAIHTTLRIVLIMSFKDFMEEEDKESKVSVNIDEAASLRLATSWGQVHHLEERDLDLEGQGDVIQNHCLISSINFFASGLFLIKTV